MGSNDKEIERKYLLRALPAAVAAVESVEIDQGYIPGERIQERIRRIRDTSGMRYYRTVKLGSGVERFEFEDPTNAEFFDAVWPLTVGRRVRKRRYELPVAGGGVWEVDEFLDRELVLAEIEFESVDQKIDIPEFISSVLLRDVTDEREFQNYRLAR
jgi:CYTH domain-containing protein